MKRLLSLCVVATLVACASGNAPLNSDQEDEVRAVIGGFADTWNRHDMEAFAALFAEDADFVNVIGMRWVGRPAIQEAHAGSHASVFKNSRLTIGETSVRFLKPDVAVARSFWSLTGHTTPTGDPGAPRQGILTNVLVRSGGQWEIVVGQNTDIVPPRR